MSQPSLAPYVMKRPWLMRWAQPLSKWYFDNAGYRKLGLRYERSGIGGGDHWVARKVQWWKQRTDEDYRSDDLIPEESEIMQRALKRLSPKDAYDRVFRMRRAFQVHQT